MNTDEKLRQQVIEELSWDSALKADQVLVQVSDGIVTLSGNVVSHAERWHAEQAVAHVAGVVDLINQIDVVLPSSHVRTDSDLVAAAVAALQWNTSLADHRVKVSVADGWLVLGGEVDSEHQRQTAGYAVRYLQGIKGISNDIVVKTQGGHPVDRASVVVRFVQGHSIVKLGKAVRTTFELRTNQDGEAKIPSIPQGKILVQVIAKGYQTFGQTFDVNEDEKTLDVTLNPPQQQYSAHE